MSPRPAQAGHPHNPNDSPLRFRVMGSGAGHSARRRESPRVPPRARRPTPPAGCAAAAAAPARRPARRRVLRLPGSPPRRRPAPPPAHPRAALRARCGCRRWSATTRTEPGVTRSVDVAAGHRGHRRRRPAAPTVPRSRSATGLRVRAPAATVARRTRRLRARRPSRREPGRARRAGAPRRPTHDDVRVADARRRSSSCASTAKPTRRRAACTDAARSPAADRTRRVERIVRARTHAARTTPRTALRPRATATPHARRDCRYELPSRWRRNSASMKESRSPSSTASTLPVS